MIELKNNHQLIGTIGLRNFKNEEDYAEIGYELDPIYQQKGFMSEALQQVIEFGIQEMELKIIEAFIHKNNIASIALLKKHQFILDSEKRDNGFENNRSYRLEK